MSLTTTFGLPALTTRVERSLSAVDTVVTELDGLADCVSKLGPEQASYTNSLPVVGGDEDFGLSADNDVAKVPHNVWDEGDDGEGHGGC